MNVTDLEDRMRSMESFHSIRLLPGAWTIVRVDGRSFSRFTEARFEKPFDLRFHEHMIEATKALVQDLHGLYAFTESDEISVLFRPEWDLFDRELEKLVSLAAAIASSAFTHACGERAQFDGRVWLGVDEATVVDYFRWRQADAARCALNGWCYWTLRKAGKTVAEATAELEGKSTAFKNELLFRHGINFNDVPAWQRRGTGVSWERFAREGFNPKENRAVVTTRRRLKVDRELPIKDAYAASLRELLAPARGT